jgi:RNA polymerase sigma-70 factor (ECF subfamily)
VVDPDLPLVHATRNGDVSAFEELVKRYDRRLYRIAEGITHNDEDAEEVVQMAFLKAYQNLSRFQGSAKFSTWLIRIAINESFMKLRKRQRAEKFIDYAVEREGEAFVVDVADWRPSPETLFSASEFREILINSLQKLTPALRAVFVLRDMEEYSLSETAELLKITSTTVRTRLSRARLKLREELSKHFKKPE